MKTPSVAVPVLSITTTSTLRMVSSTRVSLTRMPRRAARRRAAARASGVAIPRAHGQAITSTAMACISASAGWPVHRPAGEGQHREGQHRGNEDARHAVHRALHAGAAAGRLLHGADNLRQRAVRTHAGGADLQDAAGIHAAADHRVARRLGTRRRFAGEHRFIGVRAAFEHDAIGGNALAGFHAEERAGLQRVHGDEALAAVHHQPRLAGHQAIEQGDGARRAFLGAALDGLAGEHQGHDGAGGIEERGLPEKASTTLYP